MSALARVSAAAAAEASVNGYTEAGDGSTAERVMNVGEIQGTRARFWTKVKAQCVRAPDAPTGKLLFEPVTPLAAVVESSLITVATSTSIVSASGPRKGCSNGVFDALLEQEGWCGWPLLLPCAGGGRAGPVSITDRVKACVNCFHQYFQRVGSKLQKQSRRLSTWRSTASRERIEGSPAQIGGARAADAHLNQCWRRRRRSGRLPRRQVHQRSVRCSLNCEGCHVRGLRIGRRGRREGGGGSTRRSSSVVAMHLARTWRCAVRAVPRSSAVVQAVPRWCTSTRRAGGLGRRGAIRLRRVTGVQGRVARATGGGASSQHLNVAWRRRWLRGSASLRRGQPRATMAICTT